MRNGLLLVGGTFAATLAVVVGNRLSNEALAVVVGALCGIGATIPVSIGLLIVASRRTGLGESARDPNAPRHYPAQPPVVVISPPQGTTWPYALQSQHYLPPVAPAADAPREFRIIGEE